MSRSAGSPAMLTKVAGTLERNAGWLLAVGLCGLALGGCGGGQAESQEPVRRETAADEILRISETWTASVGGKKLLSAPSKISMSRSKRISDVTLSQDSATEVLTIQENVELRNGKSVLCKTVFEHTLKLRYGRRAGEAAVELTRPPLNKLRVCDAAHPEPVLQEDARGAIFVLKADQLVVVEPSLDDRAYLPSVF